VPNFHDLDRLMNKKNPKIYRKPFSKHTDMTIHWRALEEHFLMVHVSLVFCFTHFWGGNIFLGIFVPKKISSKTGTTMDRLFLKDCTCTRTVHVLHIYSLTFHTHRHRFPLAPSPTPDPGNSYLIERITRQQSDASSNDTYM
jgi:hypothetical protein